MNEAEGSESAECVGCPSTRYGTTGGGTHCLCIGKLNPCHTPHIDEEHNNSIRAEVGERLRVILGLAGRQQVPRPIRRSLDRPAELDQKIELKSSPSIVPSEDDGWLSRLLPAISLGSAGEQLPNVMFRPSAYRSVADKSALRCNRRLRRPPCTRLKSRSPGADLFLARPGTDLSTAGFGVFGLVGPRTGSSSGVLPGKLSGGGGSPGSRIGEGTSGRGLPGWSSFGGSVGLPGVGCGISGGSVGAANKCAECPILRLRELFWDVGSIWSQRLGG